MCIKCEIREHLLGTDEELMIAACVIQKLIGRLDPKASQREQEGYIRELSTAVRAEITAEVEKSMVARARGEASPEVTPAELNLYLYSQAVGVIDRARAQAVMSQAYV